MRMPVSAFLKMCRCKHLIPHLLNVEALQDFISSIYTPMTVPENKWMEEEKVLLKICEKDVNPTQTHIETNDEEPKLLFHEFIFLLAMIATQKNNTDSLSAINIENFFIEQLCFRKIEDENKVFKSFDEVKHGILSGKSAKNLALYDDGSDISIEIDDDEDSEFELDEQQAALKKFLENRSKQDAGLYIDFNEVLEILDDVLPMIPGLPEV